MHKPMSQYVRDFFNSSSFAGKTNIVQVSRQCFDQNAGTMKVETVASSFLPTEVLRLHHLMAASYAVLKYVEHVQNITFSKNGLIVEFQGLKGKLQIDHDSAINLEIISNKRNGREHSSASLFGLFFCNTVVGARLLRGRISFFVSHPLPPPP
jgi:DNA mismatch repair ATPase MutS